MANLAWLNIQVMLHVAWAVLIFCSFFIYSGPDRLVCAVGSVRCGVDAWFFCDLRVSLRLAVCNLHVYAGSHKMICRVCYVE